MTRDAALESILQSAFAEQAERYSRILEVTGELPSAFQQGDTGAVRLQTIQNQLEEIAAIEMRIAPRKAVWERNGRPASPELEETLRRLQSLMRQVVERIRIAEQEAAAQMSRLETELDTAARGRQMLRAYGAS